MDRIEIRIPATSANLGPGFDCLGLALNLFNVATVSWQDEQKLTPVELKEWVMELPFEQYAIATAYSFYASQMEIDLPRIEIDFACDIPIARGLGSSATCVIAGLVAGQLFHKGSSDKKELLNLSTYLEGHPDNVAPAIMGGLVLSGSNGDEVITASLPCHENIHIFLMIPDFELSTDEARAVLPKSILHSDAVKQVASFGFLVQGLASGRHDLLRHGNADYLHEPYRRKLVPEYESIERIALTQGCSVVSLSGAGPSLLGLYAGSKDEADRIESSLHQSLLIGWKVKRLQVNHSGMIYSSR
jgi:homoserine kinase